jgi:hypothetical protein
MNQPLPKNAHHSFALAAHLRKTVDAMNVDQRRTPQGTALAAAADEIERITGLLEPLLKTLEDEQAWEKFDIVDEILHP